MSNYTHDGIHGALGLPSLDQLRSGAIPEGVTALRSMEAGARAEGAAAAREATSMAREATNLMREAAGTQPRREDSGKILGLPWAVWAVGGVAAAGAVFLYMRKKKSSESASLGSSSLSPNRGRHKVRGNPTLYVVERECAHCGAPLGEGVVGVREMREGETLGERQMRDDEIPSRFIDAARRAHGRLAIVKRGTCFDCREY